MNVFMLVSVFMLIAAVIYGLGVWQRKIEDERKRKLSIELREAKEFGTDKAIAQYPHIDAQTCIGCGSCVAVCPEDGVLGMVDGIARVIHGSRCVGHGLCEDVCPVNAIKVGLGDDPSVRADIPVLSDRLETSVPGLFIGGELGGFALVRIALEQGARAMEAIAQDLRSAKARSKPDDAVDVLIVGAGPAGISATLKAVERGLTYATIDQDDLGGTVLKYPRRKLVLCGEVLLPMYGRVKKEEFLKEELIAFWADVFKQFKLVVRPRVKFLALEGQAGSFVAQTSAGPIKARRVLLAIGRRGSPRKLGVPGEELEKVLYQLVDTATYHNEHILIVGGGDSAVEAATGLANQTGNVVTLSYRRERFFRLKPRNLERIEEYSRRGQVNLVFGSQVQSIEKEAVTIKVTESGADKTLKVKNDYTFVLAGGEPPYPLLKGMGIRFGGDEVVDADPDGLESASMGRRGLGSNANLS